MKLLFFSRLAARFMLAGSLLLLLSTVSAQTTTYSTPGSHSYIVPSGQSQTVTIKVWGAGAGGRTRSSGGNNAGGGGGGGAYSEVTVTLEAGSYDVSVGSGGGAGTGGGISYFEIVPFIYVISADGGNAGSFLSPTQGGSGGNAAPTGSWSFWGATSIVANGGGNGANGANGNGGYGGGGGGAAGAGGDGSNGLNQAHGTGNGAGGDGGDGANSSTNAVPGVVPGGGGGGGFRVNSNNERSGGSGGNGMVEITVLQVLPVQFGAITATTGGDALLVNFTTLEETNNDHFNIQASEDGKDFKTIATVKSKHAGTVFTGTTTYSIRIDRNGNAVLMGLSILAAAALGFGGARRNRKIFMTAVLSYILIGVAAVSCSKNSAEIVVDKNDQKGYMRIEQVDADGHSRFSKVISVVVNE